MGMYAYAHSQLAPGILAVSMLQQTQQWNKKL